MSYTKKIDNTFTILKAIVKQTKQLKAKQTAYDLALPIIKSFEGKKVTKRIQTKLNEAMPEFTISYVSSWTYIELRIWGNGINYQSNLVFNLCKVDGDKILKMDKVIEYPQWFNFKEQLDELSEFRKDINQTVKDWNDFVEMMETKSKQFKSIPYPAREHFQLPTVY
jgi:hypothetical protein